MIFTRQTLIGSVFFLMSLFVTTMGLAETVVPSADLAETVVPSADGVPIAYQVQGEGEPALVFVHGWSCDQSYWDAQVEYFAKHFTVVTLDLAGHGKSGLDRKQWSMEAFGADVVSVVTQLDLKHVILIGHSLGGSVVIEAARHIPERVIGVVGIDTLQNVELKVDPERIDQVLAPLQKDVAGFTKKIVHSMFPSTSDPAVVEKVLADMSSAPPEVAVNTMRASIEFDLAQACEDVQAPVRCINSDKFPTDIEANRRHLQFFEVVFVPGAGHFFFLEDPQTFNDLYLGKIVEELTSLAAQEENAE